ncbi:MAG TPA: hypothetical protein VJ844_10795 [Mucilaginibacter sp.]|nr:hypothetical protein [Mucilaginibacter sp.]
MTLMCKRLVKKEGVKRIGCRKDCTAKYGVIVVIIDQAFVNFYFDPAKVFIEPDNPNALKK